MPSRVPSRRSSVKALKPFLGLFNLNTLFNDIYFSPVHADFLCEVIEEASRLSIKGTYNVGSVDSINKAKFFLKLAKGLDLDISCTTVCNSMEVDGRAERPKDMSLDVSRFATKFSITPPLISDTIKSTIKEYRN